nr:immunoglobulin light chain junction region [Macaca mulatta]MOX11333.1 immunoglobulin light chain junction region [Macaca mulatta]MOX11606.1 immunoglobulin light chain junction region [Macaca mulatta]MOX11757.1 immunoglobulin light chain junction region [Macaca mulatta]MOX12050.1 immunoglobulin light chain junction region [Macaca mulatta]
DYYCYSTDSGGVHRF